MPQRDITLVQAAQVLLHETANTMEQITFGLHVKMILAFMATVFTKIMFGNVIVLEIYFLFFFIDMAMGVLWALVVGKFDVRRVAWAALKLCVHLSFICLFGLVIQAVFQTFNIQTAAVNYVIFTFIVIEFTSIVDKAHRMGLPMDRRFTTVLLLLRKFTASRIAEAVGQPQMREQLEQALAASPEAESDAPVQESAP